MTRRYHRLINEAKNGYRGPSNIEVGWTITGYCAWESEDSFSIDLTLTTPNNEHVRVEFDEFGKEFTGPDWAREFLWEYV